MYFKQKLTAYEIHVLVEKRNFEINFYLFFTKNFAKGPFSVATVKIFLSICQNLQIYFF